MILFWNPADGRDKLRLFLNCGVDKYLFLGRCSQELDNLVIILLERGWGGVVVNLLGKLFDIPGNVFDGLRIQVDARVDGGLLPQPEPDDGAGLVLRMRVPRRRGGRPLQPLQLADAGQGGAHGGGAPEGRHGRAGGPCGPGPGAAGNSD